MKTWADFHDQYLSDVPGCTYFAAQNELRHAARDFCERTQAWRVTMDPIVTVADVSLYDVDRTSQTELVKLISAKLDGQKLHVMLPDEEDEYGATGIQMVNERQFALYPTPADGLNAVLKAVLKPSLEASGVDNLLYAMYAKEISYGAKARLMGETSKPYSNPMGAAQNEAWFESAVARIHIKVIKAHSRAPLRVRASFF